MRRRKVRLRAILAMLVLATTVPLGLFAGLLVLRSWDQQRVIVERQNQETARAVSVAIDKEVDSARAALQVLASLNISSVPDVERFRALALRLVPTQLGWQAVLLVSPSGEVLVDTSVEPGEPTVLGSRRWVDAVASTRRPAVSNLFEDATGRYFFALGVPVVRGGTLRFVVGARIYSESLSNILRRQSPPPDGVITLIDGNTRIMARTRNEAALLGKPPSEGFAAASKRMAEGSWRETLLEGTPAYASLSRSSLTGWTVGVGLPVEAIDGPIRRSFLLLTGVWAGVLGLGLGLSLLLGRQILREQAHALAAEQAARREAEASSRGKDEFVATVSHELRTPLNAIYGWIRLLRSGRLDDAGREHAIEVIERNTRAQTQLIDELLDMSRVITGNLRLDMSRVDLSEVIRSAVDAVRPTADAKQLQIGLRITDQESFVLGDSTRLQQIVWNLLTNSLKFTPRGGRVDVSLSADGPEGVLCVEDTGVGISPELLPHVFERFRQGSSSPSRTHDGLGIGLSLVRHLVELHGGSVTVSSEGEGKGAKFTVRLPLLGTRSMSLTERLAVTSPGGVLSAPDTADDQPLAGTRVLIVDDDADARDLIGTTLTQAGAEVTAAGSMRDAVAVFSAARPHVVLSDIAMPNGTGYDLVRHLRGTPGGAELSIVALTAYDRREDRERILASGFDAHISKPVDPTVLVRALASAANGKRMAVG